MQSLHHQMTDLDDVTPVRYSNVMTGFTKLFQGIVHSTIWREPMHVKIVWVTMLAMADRDGGVSLSIPGLADLSKVSLSECVDALARLKAPDEWSRTKEHEGRRIEDVDDGWVILNYLKYRNLMNRDDQRIKTRERVQRHRALKRVKRDVTLGNDIAEAEAEAEAEVEMVSSVEIQKVGKDQDRAGVSNLPIRRPLDPFGNQVALQRLVSGETHLAIPTAQATRGREARQLLEHRAEFVFRYACARWGKTKGYRLDDKRRRRLMTRLNEAEGEMTDLLYAADGAKLDPWISGLDPQSTKDFLTIDTVYRDRGQVERLRDLVKDVQEKHPIEVEGEAVAQ